MVEYLNARLDGFKVYLAEQFKAYDAYLRVH